MLFYHFRSKSGNVTNDNIEIRDTNNVSDENGDDDDEDGNLQPKKLKTKRPASMFEPRENNTLKANFSNENRSTTSMYQIARKSGQQLRNISAVTTTPTREQLKPHTDRLTRCIQELWNEMQTTTGNKETIVPYSEKIVEAVNELTAQFPKVTFGYFS